MAGQDGADEDAYADDQGVAERRASVEYGGTAFL